MPGHTRLRSSPLETSKPSASKRTRSRSRRACRARPEHHRRRAAAGAAARGNARIRELRRPLSGATGSRLPAAGFRARRWALDKYSPSLRFISLGCACAQPKQQHLESLRGRSE
jgi:hypothetical protein